MAASTSLGWICCHALLLLACCSVGWFPLAQVIFPRASIPAIGHTFGRPHPLCKNAHGSFPPSSCTFFFPAIEDLVEMSCHVHLLHALANSGRNTDEHLCAQDCTYFQAIAFAEGSSWSCVAGPPVCKDCTSTHTCLRGNHVHLGRVFPFAGGGTSSALHLAA